MNTQKRADRLYHLLPAVYRIRDVDKGWQLQALLRVIAEQVNAVEDDINQLYENWFIETCQDWVVPYIGDLVGYQQVHDAGEPGDDTIAESRTRNTILIPRRDVGNTIYYRRRRGTLAVLEQLASGVAGWPYVHAVEFYKYLGMTQNTNFPRSERGRLIDLRDNRALFAMGSPLAHEAHTVDVRRAISQGAGEQGRYNIPNVGLFIWRLKPYAVIKRRAGKVSKSHFTFSVFGHNTQMYTHPASRQDVNGQQLAVDELNFPSPIGLRAFENRLGDYYGDGKSLLLWTLDAPHEKKEEDEDDDGDGGDDDDDDKDNDDEDEGENEDEDEDEEHKGRRKHRGRDRQHDQHGSGKAHRDHDHQHRRAYSEVTVVEKEPSEPPSTPPVQALKPVPKLVDPSRIIAADLTNWRYHPEGNKIAVDTRLGRIAFSHDHAPDRVYVSYYYTFSADIGGGMYHRPILQQLEAKVFQVYKEAPEQSSTEEQTVFSTIEAALEAWQQWKQKNATQKPPAPLHGVIEIADNGLYSTSLELELEEGEHLQIRAAAGTWPVLHLLKKEVENKHRDEEEGSEERHIEPTIRGEKGSRFTLDGLLVSGSRLRFRETIDAVTIRHCTFVSERDIDGENKSHNAEKSDKNDRPSIFFHQKGVSVSIEHSIVGPLLIHQKGEQLLRVTISDSVLNATSKEKNAAVSEEKDDASDEEKDDTLDEENYALYLLKNKRSTYAQAVLSITRSTVFGKIVIHAIDTAENCIFLDTIMVARRQQGCMRFCSVVPGSRTPRRYNCQPDLVEQAVDVNLKGYAPAERDAAKQLERNRVTPRFNSLSYGDPTYCQLARTCAVEIRHGADDESEMGVFHDLFQPQREANLRSRLDDFTPAGMEAGIFYVS